MLEMTVFSFRVHFAPEYQAKAKRTGRGKIHTLTQCGGYRQNTYIFVCLGVVGVRPKCCIFQRFALSDNGGSMPRILIFPYVWAWPWTGQNGAFFEDSRCATMGGTTPECVYFRMFEHGPLEAQMADFLYMRVFRSG